MDMCAVHNKGITKIIERMKGSHSKKKKVQRHEHFCDGYVRCTK
jgi:hypothetical protein